MINPDLDAMVQIERRKDEMRAAAYAHLLKEAEQAQVEYRTPARSLTLRPLALVLAGLLSFIGKHMVSLSCRLQYRYALVSGASDTQPCR